MLGALGRSKRHHGFGKIFLFQFVQVSRTLVSATCCGDGGLRNYESASLILSLW